MKKCLLSIAVAAFVFAPCVTRAQTMSYLCTASVHTALTGLWNLGFAGARVMSLMPPESDTDQRGALFYRSSERTSITLGTPCICRRRRRGLPLHRLRRQLRNRIDDSDRKENHLDRHGYFADSGETLPIRDTNVKWSQHVCGCGRRSIRRRLENGVQRDLHEDLSPRYDGTRHHHRTGGSTI